MPRGAGWHVMGSVPVEDGFGEIGVVQHTKDAFLPKERAKQERRDARRADNREDHPAEVLARTTGTGH